MCGIAGVMDFRGAPPSRALVRAMVLANDADTSAEAGDPLELGLYAFARSEGLDPAVLRARHPRTSGRPFDSAWKYMRATLDDEGTRKRLLELGSVIPDTAGRSPEENVNRLHEDLMARCFIPTAIAMGDHFL